MTNKITKVDFSKDLELRSLPMSLDDKGNIIVGLDTKTKQLGLYSHTKLSVQYFHNVFACNRVENGKHIPILVRNGFASFDMEHHEKNKAHYVTVQDIFSGDYEDYIKKAVNNALDELLSKPDMLAHLAGESNDVKYVHVQVINLKAFYNAPRYAIINGIK